MPVCFSRYVRAGCEEVSDVGLLDRLAQTGAEIGVKRPVELYVNPLVSSPLLLGFFRPCIVLPDASLPEDEFAFTIRHAGRRYIWYNGFAWDYAFRPVRTDSGWQIDITKLRKKDAGYVLLSVPDEGELTLSVDGKPVSFTVLNAK